MALKRGGIIGYDSNRMMFEFTMKTPNEKIVKCQISSIAMNDLDGVRGISPPEREAQFIRHRDIIEKIAVDIFKISGPTHVGVIHIFEKHLPGEKRRRNPLARKPDLD